MSSLSAIMALKIKGRHYAENIGRCDILFQSFRHFGLRPLFSEWLIVIPGAERVAIERHARAWEDFPIRFVIEDQYLEVFKRFSKLHQVRNWHRQQLIKLMCAEFVKNDYFLVLDPDIFAVKPVRHSDLIVGGRALVEADRRDWHADWWQDSADLLGVEPNLDRPGMGVTPALLSREACRGLTRYIETLHQRSWHEVLLSRYATQWTEYTLYNLYLEHTGQFERFHVTPSAAGLPQRLHSPAPWGVWKSGDYEKLDFAELFSAKNPGLFTVVQSNVGVTPERIAADLAPHMPVQIQAYEREPVTLVDRARELYGAALRRGLGLFQERSRRALRTS